jgi:hypothetical protein
MNIFVFIFALVFSEQDALLPLEMVEFESEEECALYLDEYNKGVVQPNMDYFQDLMEDIGADQVIGACVPKEIAEEL